MESVFASATDVHSEHQRYNSQVRNKGWILCKSIGSIHHQLETLVNIAVQYCKLEAGTCNFILILEA